MQNWQKRRMLHTGENEGEFGQPPAPQGNLFLIRVIFTVKIAKILHHSSS